MVPDGGECSAIRLPLYPQGKSPWYPLMDGPQSRSGRGDEEKHSRLLPELEPQIIEPVRILSFLSQNTPPLSCRRALCSAPCITNLATGWRWLGSFTLWSL